MLHRRECEDARLSAVFTALREAPQAPFASSLFSTPSAQRPHDRWKRCEGAWKEGLRNLEAERTAWAGTWGIVHVTDRKLD